mgnify:CR=1 FL=1
MMPISETDTGIQKKFWKEKQWMIFRKVYFFELRENIWTDVLARVK